MTDLKSDIPIGIGRNELLERAKTGNEGNTTRKFIFKEGVTCTIAPRMGGYQLLFESKRGRLSAIFHAGSYGSEAGLWEIMPPRPPKSWGDSVLGQLTFQDVIKWVNKQL